MRASVLRIVTVVEDEHAFHQEEAEEPGADEACHQSRVVDGADRLGEHVEEGDRHDDPAGERDHGLERMVEPQRHGSTESGGENRQQG